MSVISDSGLNTESVSGRVSNVESDMVSKSEVHVNKGENVWSDVVVPHGSRFSALDGKEVSFAEEIQP